MGQLKPSATYVYDHEGGVVYAREKGEPKSARQPIGWDWKPETTPATNNDLADHNEWIKIRIAGRTNPALQQAIDRVKLLYKLSQEKYE